MPTILTKTSQTSIQHWRRVLATLTIGALLLAGNRVSANSPIVNRLLQLPAHHIASIYGAQRVYSITRNGKKIGTHTLSFHREADTLTVQVDSSLTVRILRIPVYRLSYTSEEIWRDDALLSASATTIENGDSNTIAWNNKNGDSTIQFASNHWHPGVLTGKPVFNTLTGDTNRINVTTISYDQTKTGDGKTIKATHYQYDDDIHTNVWYDDDGLWLMMKFTADDGSLIQYLRTY